MDILSLIGRTRSPFGGTLVHTAKSPPVPKAVTAQPSATPSAPISPTIKRMLERSEEAKQAMEAAKAKEKIAAKERRKIIKQRLDQILEKLRILKNLYANDPKKMAQNLAEVFKELKTALKDYRNAGGTLTQMIGDSNGMGQRHTEQEPLNADEAKEWVEAANDAKAFIGNVGAIAKKVKELLEESRLKAKLMEPDEDRDKAFEEADKQLKELTEFMEDMGKNISEALENMQLQGEDTATPDMGTAVPQGVDVQV